MSYLDLPRLTFSGQFFADPSTLNNTPNNYNANRVFPTAGLSDGLFQPPANDNNIDLFWNPNGSGAFGFVDCAVRTVAYADGASGASDPIVGQPVASNVQAKSPYTQAKIVDLDPMQQNVSEIWGMNVSLGDLIAGDFVEAAFIAIWLQAKDSPPGDTAGSALYQSTLINLKRSASELASQSRFLRDVADRDALSICFTVRAHNSAPQSYLVSKSTMEAMAAKGVPDPALAKIAPLALYASHPTSPKGLIPTESYFRKLLNGLLCDGDKSFVNTIMAVAKQPYTPATPFDFTHGEIVGDIGPQSAGEPRHFSAARMMAPNPALPKPKFGPYDPICNYAPFQVAANGAKATVALNLGNALPTKTPGSAFYADKLGTLKLCRFDLAEGEAPSKADATPIGAAIEYTDTERFFRQGAGLADLSTDGEIAGKPLGLAQVDGDDNVVEVFLRENVQGYYLRADKFVYRMEPGTASAEQAVDIYVTRFGRPAAGVVVKTSLMTPDEAVSYSNNTPGTGGSPGVLNLSVPQSAIMIVNQEAATDARGKATVTVKASDPGNPRSYVDGQIYYLKYTLASADADYAPALDDVVSIQVYQRDPQSLLIADNGKDKPLITWNNGVRDILAQYDKLYPVMSFLDMGDYDAVVKPETLASIKSVLETDLTDPTHMPVTRDMSASRRNVILNWIANGAPR